MPRMQQEPKVAPPSAPFLSNTPADAPDDIPDPLVPASLAAEAMAQATPGVPMEAPTIAVVPSNGTAPVSVPPTVPALPEAILPLAHGFCQYVQGLLSQQLEDAGIRMTKSVDLAMSGMAQYTQGVLSCNEHAEMQLSDALLKLGEQGLKLLETPYTLQVQVRTPAGIPLTLTVRKQTAGELLDELTRLEGWLASNGYTGLEVLAA